MVRDFLGSGDNCIKDPENLTCYESTVMKWKKLAIDLTKKSHFSNEFDRYLVDQTRVLKEGVKPTQRERWERKKQLKKQLESLIKQRQWDEVFKMIADKDATFYNRLYLTREFFDARDDCIKNPDIACYEETMTKWEELATNLNKWSPFSRKFSIYLNSLNDAFKAKIKPIYEAQIKKQEEARMKREKAREADLKTYRERVNSADAESRTEAFFHGEARALVILHVEPNKLRVGGREFRVKRNPVGKGCFVYDPRTEFYGVKRNLVWLVTKDGKAYPLNSPSKMVTPSLKWPREEGVDAPSMSAVIDYVFEGKPMSASPPIPSPSTSKTGSFTVKEYKIYRAVIDTPMTIPEAQALQNAAKRYGVTVAEAQKATKKVQNILFSNKWFASPEAEIRHASDWKEEKP
jgi:hypothetical protein